MLRTRGFSFLLGVSNCLSIKRKPKEWKVSKALWNVCSWKVFSGFTSPFLPIPPIPPFPSHRQHLHACLRTRYNQNILKPAIISMIEAVLSLIRLRGRKSRLQWNNGKGVVFDRKGEEVNTKDKTFTQGGGGTSPWWELGLPGLTGKEGEWGWQRREWILSAAKWDRRREGRGVEEPENRPQRRSRTNPDQPQRSGHGFLHVWAFPVYKMKVFRLS